MTTNDHDHGANGATHPAEPDGCGEVLVRLPGDITAWAESLPHGATVDAAAELAAEAATTWGWEMLMDMTGCEPSLLRERNNMASFLRTLVAAIGMRPVGPPVLDWFGEGPEHEGWTVYQRIETSSIVGHFMPATRRGFLNVFSCREFDPAVAELVVRQYLRPKVVDWALVPRG